MPAKSHGLSHKLPEYWVWMAMKQRCSNPKHVGYPNYGARGIVVCERWASSFPNFLEDMGPRPSKSHSLERDDSGGNYEPSNCRWATRLEQANNKRNNRMIEWNGALMSIPDACRISGSPVEPRQVGWRVRQGWPANEALLAPLHTKIRTLAE